MRKLWTLAFKEIKLAFRDVGAIVTMLVTPLVLTLAIGAAFGTGGAPLSDIPVLLLNRDDGPLSGVVQDALTSEAVAHLLSPELVSDEAAARARVDDDEVAALVIIPSDFSERAVPIVGKAQKRLGISFLSLDGESALALSEQQQADIAQLYAEILEEEDDPVVVEIYASPNWRISTAVIKGIVTRALEQMNMTTHGISTIMERLIVVGALQVQDDESGTEALSVLSESGLQGTADRELPVRLQIVSPSGRGFSWLDYSASSMAVLFLMFAVTSGGRTLLAERQEGTLPRLLVSPTPAMTVLAGKMAGIFLTGLLQISVLWGATSLIGAYWGPPGGVAAALVILVLCATGVGALISAWARSAGQAGAIGTAVTLIASAVSGTFFPRMNLPQWVQTISLITPNAWGIELFSALQTGRGLLDILPLLGGALALTAAYYVAALIGFRRQFS